MENKIERFIEYLRDLARINLKINYTLEDYSKILWLHEIPKELKFCFTRAWGIEDEHGDDTLVDT